MTEQLQEGCEIEIPAAWLKGALLCAGKMDVRFYLNGVYLDFPAGNLVATDGHRMFCGRLPADAPRDVRPVIVPRELIERALKGVTVKALEREYFIVEVASGDGADTLRAVTLRTCGGVFTAQELDGRYPDYTRVIPREPNGQPCAMNAEYYLDGCNALSWYQKRRRATVPCAEIAFCGPDRACILYMQDVTAIVVVMPVRVRDGSFNGSPGVAFPDFAGVNAPEATEAAPEAATEAPQDVAE